MNWHPDTTESVKRQVEEFKNLPDALALLKRFAELGWVDPQTASRCLDHESIKALPTYQILQRAFFDKKLKPDVLIDIPAARLKYILELSRKSLEVQSRKLKMGDTNNLLELEVCLVNQLGMIFHSAHQACQSNPEQKTILMQMVDRLQVLGNQFEELFVHDRELINDFEEEHSENAVFFDEDNIPEAVQEAIEQNVGK